MENKSYDVTVALATMLASPATASRDELRGMLVAGSDIPAERIDFAMSELTEVLAAMRGMVVLQETLLGRKASIAEIQAIVAGATWIDDDKGEATYTTVLAEENGEEAASISIKKKLNH